LGGLFLRRTKAKSNIAGRAPRKIPLASNKNAEIGNQNWQDVTARAGVDVKGKTASNQHDKGYHLLGEEEKERKK